MLTVSALSTGYGRIEALKEVSITVPEGQITTLIGANGAGKTTLLMSVCGKPKAWNGTLTFHGQNITGWQTHRIMRLGIAHAPEGRRIFPRLTVRENLQLGAVFTDARFFRDDLEVVYTLFPRLEERQHQRGGTLSGGEQQMLAIARALMARPSLLLLDEPSLGLAPLVVKQIFEALRRLNDEQGLTILLVEQNAHHALRLAHHAYVLVNGAVTLQGTGKELQENPAVKAAYLGIL
jgi:branched-chain amino acid transport system ATP-binding protein